MRLTATNGGTTKASTAEVRAHPSGQPKDCYIREILYHNLGRKSICNSLNYSRGECPDTHPSFVSRRPHGNKPAPQHGRIEGDTWRKTARASRHMLRRPRGWAVDAADLEAVERLGVEVLEVHDTESGVIWSAPLLAFRRYGVPISRGFGQQIALPLVYWSRSDEGEQLALPLEVAHGQR